MKPVTIVSLILATVVTGAVGSQAEDDPVHTWKVDLAHSSIQFRARHWGIVDVIGWFESFSAELRATEQDFGQADVQASVDLDSVRMPNPGMAENLRQLVFQTESFPVATFQSTSIRRADRGTFVVRGDLTLHGRTRPIELTAQFNGFGIPPLGSPGFTVDGEILLSEFDLAPPENMLENRAPTIGDRVVVRLNLRLEYSYE